MRKRLTNRMVDLLQVIKASKGLPVKDTVSRLMGIGMPVVYGWHIDPSEPDPSQAVTYLRNARGKTPAAMGASVFSYGGWENAFFMPRPCMLRYDGTVDYYLDPNDYTKKADGTASDIANADYGGNVMMEWPLIWYKFEPGEARGEGYFYCSDRQIDESFKCWCNIGSDNNITEHFYTSVYNTTYKGGRLRSLSGLSLSAGNGAHSVSFADEAQRAAANNTGTAHEWDTSVFCDRQLITALLVLMGKSLNTQAVFGNGLVNAGSVSSYSTGVLNDKGLFWGDTSGRAAFVKVFGMENWWGCLHDATAGIVSANDKWKVKLTYGTSDGSSGEGYDNTGSGYITASDIPASSGIQRLMAFSPLGYLPERASEYGDPDMNGQYYTDSLSQSTMQIALEQGGTSGTASAGTYVSKVSTNDRCRSAEFSNYSGGTIEVISNAPGVQVNWSFADIRSGDTYYSIEGGTGWFDSPHSQAGAEDFLSDPELCIIVLVRFSDNSDITPAQAGNYVTVKNKSPRLLYFGGAYYSNNPRSGAFFALVKNDIIADSVSTRLSCKPVSSLT